MRRDRINEQRMPRHRKNVRAAGLPIPARDTGEAVPYILDLDVERRRIEEIETASR
jgi:hypothetical protein